MTRCAGNWQGCVIRTREIRRQPAEYYIEDEVVVVVVVVWDVAAESADMPASAGAMTDVSVSVEVVDEVSAGFEQATAPRQRAITAAAGMNLRIVEVPFTKT